MAKFMSALVAVVMAGMVALGAEPLKSGPQAGEKVPGPFKPLNATGEDAGKEECLYCKHGQRPVVMVFAREFTPAVGQFIKKLDDATAKSRDTKIGTCVIFLSDAKNLPTSLAHWAQDAKVTHTVLATYESSGPTKYAIAPDAAVTVLIYAKQVVKVNHTFAAGKLGESDINTILADLNKILPRD